MIYIYFHCCTIENWEQVVTFLFERVKKSGLLDLCDEFRVVVLGEHLERAKEIMNHPKVKIIFYSTDISLHERPCLEHMREAAETEDFKTLYFHSKGVRKKNEALRDNIQDWIEMMCYFLFDGYAECLGLLDKHRCAVGVNYKRASAKLLQQHATNRTTRNSNHFSGNFWWSSSQFLRTLPKKIGPKYLDPELWVGLGQGMLVSLHQSSCKDHYFHRYHPNKYQGRKHQKVINL